MIPTSIDGTDITGATIDGTDVTEITVDGQTVFSADSRVAVDNLLFHARFENNLDDDIGSANGTATTTSFVSSGGAEDYQNGPDSAYLDMDASTEVDWGTRLHERPDNGQSITMMCWVKSSNWSDNTYRMLLGGSGSGLHNTTHISYFRSAQGAPSNGFCFNTIINGQVEFLANNSPHDANEWYHLCGTYDASTDSHDLFINGVSSIDGSLNISRTASSVDMVTGGDWFSSSSTNNKFEIDEARIYDIALSQTQIQDIVDNSAPNAYPYP